MGRRATPAIRAGNMLAIAQPAEGYVTRLHVRYDAQSFPEDLNFIETSDHESFQARYIMHHPYEGAGAAQRQRDVPRLAAGAVQDGG